MPTIPELEQSLNDAANYGDVGTILSIVTSLTTGEKEQINPEVFGYALTAVIYSDVMSSAGDAGTFVEAVGFYTVPYALTMGMLSYAQYGALDGVTAIADNLDPLAFAGLDAEALGETLLYIPAASFGDLAGAAATAGNYLSHFSLFIDSSLITRVMQDFLQYPNFAGLNAVIDNTDPQIFSSLDAFELGEAFRQIPAGLYRDVALTLATVENFLSHLAQYTDPFAISIAMFEFTLQDSLDGVNVILQNTDAQIFSGVDTSFLDQVLPNIAAGTYTHGVHDAAATLREFSSELLTYVSDFAIEQTMQFLYDTANLPGIAAVLDHATATQWDNLPSMMKDNLASLGITFGTYAEDNLDGTRDVDTLFGLGGDDALQGKRGDDFLFGNAGDDKLKGGDGNDYFDGGIGVDRLTGGAGADIFALNNYEGVDRIKDFEKGAGGDTLDLRDLLNDYELGDAITDYVHARSTGAGNTIISFDADGAGAGSAIDMAKLKGVTGVDIQTLFDQGQILI